MSIRLPVLDERDFVFPGPNGLCSYRAAAGDRPAELHLPGPNGTDIRLTAAGEGLSISVDGTFIASTDDFYSLSTPLRNWLIENYFAALRAAKEHRAPAVEAALRALDGSEQGHNKPA